MVQFHNAPSNFANLASGEDGHWLSEPTTCFKIMGKEFFLQNWSNNNAKKNRLQDFYDIFDLHM